MSDFIPIVNLVYTALGVGVVIVVLVFMAVLRGNAAEPTAKDVPELKRKLMGLLEEENNPQEISDIIWYIEVTRKRESG